MPTIPGDKVLGKWKEAQRTENNNNVRQLINEGNGGRRNDGSQREGKENKSVNLMFRKFSMGGMRVEVEEEEEKREAVLKGMKEWP